MEETATTVGLKPRRFPKRLRDLAKEQQIEPEALIAKVLSESFTFVEAAEALGVTEPTLRSYRRLTGVGDSRSRLNAASV